MGGLALTATSVPTKLLLRAQCTYDVISPKCRDFGHFVHDDLYIASNSSSYKRFFQQALLARL